MIFIQINKANLHVLATEILTAGMSNAVECSFDWSPEWDDLSRIAVFTNDETTIDVVLENDSCNVPPEVLNTEGKLVKIGIYGTDGGDVILPTIWGCIGVVYPAADPSGDESVDPTLPVWQQILGQIGDLDDLTTARKNNLVAAINEAARTGSGGGGGTVEIDNHTIVYDESGALAVNTTDEAEDGNPLPITADGVFKATINNLTDAEVILLMSQIQ